VTQHRAGAAASHAFKFATERGKISGWVRVALEGLQDNRSKADEKQAALNQSPGALERVRPVVWRLARTARSLKA
jgi:hypothetical protein